MDLVAALEVDLEVDLVAVLDLVAALEAVLVAALDLGLGLEVVLVSASYWQLKGRVMRKNRKF